MNDRGRWTTRGTVWCPRCGGLAGAEIEDGRPDVRCRCGALLRWVDEDRSGDGARVVWRWVAIDE